MSDRKKTSKATFRRGSKAYRQIRNYPRTCGSGRLYADLDRVHRTTDSCRILEVCEAMFDNFFIKLSQCRPRVQLLKSRLQQSCHLLAEIDELFEFFSDPQSLWTYLLTENADKKIEGPTNVNPSGNVSTKQTQNDDENKHHEREKIRNSDGSESYCSKKPNVETIVEEVEEGQDNHPQMNPTQANRNDVSCCYASRRSTQTFLCSQAAKHTPKSMPPSATSNEGKESLHAKAASLKSFKTSTPADRSDRQRAKRRRKAMVLEPPEPNGAWMGTPLVGNRGVMTPQEANRSMLSSERAKSTTTENSPAANCARQLARPLPNETAYGFREIHVEGHDEENSAPNLAEKQRSKNENNSHRVPNSDAEETKSTQVDVTPQLTVVAQVQTPYALRLRPKSAKICYLESTRKRKLK